MTAGVACTGWQACRQRAEDSEALACVQDAFAGASPEVRAEADEMLGVLGGLLAVDQSGA